MLKDTLERQLEVLSKAGYQTLPLVFAPPATAGEVEAAERGLGHRLPPSFSETLLNTSAHVTFRWFAPKGLSYPRPFHSSFSGDLHWSLDSIVESTQDVNEWVESTFPDPGDPYDAVWHNKLVFYAVGNGDFLGIDLNPSTYEQIVYLSHDNGNGHGFVLAENFHQLLARWVPLACAGGEDWQWLPFTTGKEGLLDPECANARRWRQLLGLDT